MRSYLGLNRNKIDISKYVEYFLSLHTLDVECPPGHHA